MSVEVQSGPRSCSVEGGVAADARSRAVQCGVGSAVLPRSYSPRRRGPQEALWSGAVGSAGGVAQQHWGSGARGWSRGARLTDPLKKSISQTKPNVSTNNHTRHPYTHIHPHTHPHTPTHTHTHPHTVAGCVRSSATTQHRQNSHTAAAAAEGDVGFGE